MTVKELKEKLNEFQDNLVIMIPNAGWHTYSLAPPDIPATDVYRGVNEADGCVFIDSYEEEDD